MPLFYLSFHRIVVLMLLSLLIHLNVCFAAAADTGSSSSSSNPFEQGCLFQKFPGWNKKRVCNSEDNLSSNREDDFCRTPAIEDYMEIRIFSENWESVFFESWLLQIILSELLDVPTTIETGTPQARLNFYHQQSPFEYGTTDDVQVLTTGSLVGDCRKLLRKQKYHSTNNETTANYEGCAHIAPEVWISSSEAVKDAVRQGHLETPRGLGIVGMETWYITKFTAAADPTLDSYLGLQGEDNRRKLAETFLRPMTWKQYCDLISTNNCTTSDGVAQRAPEEKDEYSRMFVDGLYTGHFHATEKNNCDLNPTNCSGHIADYPCGWNSAVEAQTHHLNIALESDGDEPGSGGYSYSQLIEMWHAANATKSNLISMWWTPNPQYQKYQGTDAEYHRVMLPPPTQRCINNRVGLEVRCSENKQNRIGDSAGACDLQAQSLDKLIAGSLYEVVNDPTIPPALRSPAYDVLEDFTITEFQLNEIFDYWQKEQKSPREAVCQWAAENFDYLTSFVPFSYPRVVVEKDNRAMILIATILGCIATVMVLFVCWRIHQERRKPAVRYAQIEFLRLLLSGLLLLAIGAIIVGVAPTDGTCIAAAWLINMGYTLELVPLIAKVGAINKMLHSARQMRRKVVKRSKLFAAVFVISFFMIVFLILWTTLDPLTKRYEYSLTSIVRDDATVITGNDYCRSDSDVWVYVSIGWSALLLLCASVLAVQTRNIREDFNESRTLAFLVYSHFMFVILRVVTIVLSGSVQESSLRFARSLIYSSDTIATLLIYFLPKLLHKDDSTSFTVSRFENMPSSQNTPTPPDHRDQRECNHTSLSSIHTEENPVAENESQSYSQSHE